jgi:RNA polymerase sigma-70 factor (ECF subfamily)
VAVPIDCTGLTDGELARRIAGKGGDAAAAEAELCVRFGRRVRLYGMRHLRRSHAADDLTQRVMIVVLEKLRSGLVREPDLIGSFVLGVARMLVREGWRPQREEPLPPSEEQFPAGEIALDDPLVSARLARCLANLAERERAIVVLTYYGEANSREVATTMSLAEGHVRVIRHRAMARLRACMNDVVTGRPPGALWPQGAS